jgi:N-acetylneuraminic acid mutarotase
VWGGHRFGSPLNDGAAYDPLTDRWTPISAAGAPSARSHPAGVWTGSEWVLFGGLNAAAAVAGGSAYAPATDTWRSLDNPGSPVTRSGVASVWTGSEMILFGGRNATTLYGTLERLTPQSAWYFYRKP